MTLPQPQRLLDATGLKCPKPVLKLSVVSVEMKPGEVLEIVGDCPTFEKDIVVWCARLKKTLLMMHDDGNDRKRALIRF
ncbi:MAG: sulfurtransferase TusA family protein [Desulfuromonadaceae bacterium]|nr:sulfurtransferase TusA family protein [Desulfuromonadaceae bacterium]MDD2847544.1 sulfurtransferase TusA family protein [Desulfuromonadaceae bacterium]MDD4132224.1 sulfurtransferase TusA family protein [Desulfuromonadaceae bacterium]